MASHSFQLLMAVFGVVITGTAYSVMLWKTFSGEARPHPVAWYGFGALTTVAFLVQLRTGAATGSLVLGVSFVACFVVGAVSQWKGRWHIRDFDGWDWLALLLGLGCAVSYGVSRDFTFGPLASTIWATAGDLILYAPILKNAWSRPDDENAIGYFLNSVKFLPSFGAMDVWSLETCLYPGALVLMNGLVVAYLNWRRQQNNVLPR